MKLKIIFDIEIDQLTDMDLSPDEICDAVEKILNVGTSENDIYLDGIDLVEVLDR